MHVRLDNMNKACLGMNSCVQAIIFCLGWMFR